MYWADPPDSRYKGSVTVIGSKTLQTHPSNPLWSVTLHLTCEVPAVSQILSAILAKALMALLQGLITKLAIMLARSAASRYRPATVPTAA